MTLYFTVACFVYVIWSGSVFLLCRHIIGVGLSSLLWSKGHVTVSVWSVSVMSFTFFCITG